MQELTSAQCVIFDFDGPLCRLFARRPAPAIAGRLRTTYGHALADTAASETSDPLRLLTLAFSTSSPGEALGEGEGRGAASVTCATPARGAAPVTETAPVTGATGAGATGAAPVRTRPVPGETARAIERSLTEEEIAAAVDAFPTPYADTLVRTLCATGRTVAVATDNSAAAVERYLSGRGLLGLFADRVRGRTLDQAGPRLKPDPDCVERALHASGAAPADAVMIGDSARDVRAARAAGVAFVGYARNERKERELRDGGAETITTSLRDVLLTVDPLAHV
ncbi:HAD family hydrolase [Streptomyces reniochalinae]|uniref:HAD family hydrolase n=1 Tax=Streptomyces reniochalinae TaxID=2250578 RepID=A0A367EKI5_9ACTN|nr:HAD-IA family hydrolase [Streptomyces reniochalinae]RCG18145.1 HAD family hydrolase [Streptomyces reniochalinae]